MTKTCFAVPQGTIYIRADGSIEPPTAPISTLDNVTYTLTGDIFNDLIVIERDNIVVDGAFHIAEGTGSGYGVTLSGRTNVTITKMTITAFGQVFWLDSSSNSTISGNNITNNGGGITLGNSAGNTVSGNNITNNVHGIMLDTCSNNVLSGNNVTANNNYGITLSFSSNNSIFRNNFVNNTNQVYTDGLANAWDNGFEGNYWSNYNGTDSNQDGIGDIPYVIDENNTDHRPLMGTFQSFNVSAWDLGHNVLVSGEVDVISNSTVEQVQLVPSGQTGDQYLWRLHFTILCENDTAAFYRITFPNDLLNSSSKSIWTEYQSPTNSGMYYVNFFNATILQSNGTYTIVYFTFHQPVSSYTMDVDTIPFEFSIPEFPSFLILPLFFIATLLAVIAYRRKHFYSDER